ncbi:uncharacterized protein LOC132308427 [Cornus florida]|uniref:uncharacterized protein LOC132308427 n=1 Tax=Cornus florida TaxID=4283 RepID=UPI0028A1DA84|nr:uncharacterized protein LOC132308427 [Cornus florida]
MADFEPPSFSLGLDLDFDSEPQPTVREDPSSKRAQQSSANASFHNDDDDDFESPTMGPDPQIPDPPQTLKRLRRGRTTESTSATQKQELWRSVDEEIEEFSSQEDKREADGPRSTQHHSVCSSSKFPLHGHGVLMTQSANQWKVRKRKQESEVPASASFETSSKKLMIPKLTVSPLRRFQLLDSDSDDPSVSEDVNGESIKVDLSSKERECNPGQHATLSEQKRKNASVSMSQAPDLWKDFCSEKNFHIPTPTLDEVCEEYFRSVKNKNEVQNLSENKDCSQGTNILKNDEHPWNLGDPVPPAHRYFFHDEPRIQKLVRSRLPNFYPLGAMNERGNNQLRASVIDYMGQFSHEEGSKKQAAKTGTSSTRGRKNSKKSNAEEVSQGSGSWVNPKSSAGNPKDAGKRRVHAVGQSAGHWYTAPDGRRVYVSGKGQELTGRIAYTHYRKESGRGFKKSKKKTTTKKKTKARSSTAKRGV